MSFRVSGCSIYLRLPRLDTKIEVPTIPGASETINIPKVEKRRRSWISLANDLRHTSGAAAPYDRWANQEAKKPLLCVSAGGG